MSEIKRPKEFSELARTLNPDVPYKEFEAARGVHELEAIVQYVHELERVQRNRDMYRGQVERQSATISAMRDALDEAEDYFDNRADADCDEAGYHPNKEMMLLQVVREALRKAGAE